ncbi:hypothetical protein [Nocardioides panacihumi]|uniref:hypothetical protein n=1 Tax=Nocardioides panacihumi TaxID=400774 RepID=UPI0031D0218D
MAARPEARDKRRAVPVIALLAIGMVIAIVGTVAVFVDSPTATAAPVCPTGVWSYHQARSGGCGYGIVTGGASPATRTVTFSLRGSVGDNLADGSCARVEVLIHAKRVTDTTRTYKACGKSTATTIAFSDTAPAAGAGSIPAYSVRLCVGSSCTAYVDFHPA